VFQVSEEITDSLSSTTNLKTVYFDYEQKKLRYDELNYNEFQQKTVIADFSNNLMWNILWDRLDGTLSSCQLSSTISLPEFQNREGNMITPRAFFQLDKASFINFGTRNVRGIDCNTWRGLTSSTTTDGTTQNIQTEISFSLDTWNFPGQIPIQLQTTVTTFPLEGVSTDTITVTQYFDFSTSFPSDIFEIPDSTWCTSTIPMTFPANITSQYQTFIQLNSNNSNVNVQYSAMEYYDGLNNRFRLDLFPSLGSDLTYISYNDISYKIIDSNICQFIPNNTENELLNSKSNLFEILLRNTQFNNLYVNYNNINQQFIPFKEFFELSTKYAKNYQGIKTLQNGLDCDVWWIPILFNSNFENYDVNVIWYFPKTNFLVPKSINFPARLQIQGSKISVNGSRVVIDTTYDFNEISSSSPSLETFQLLESWNCRNSKIFVMYQFDYLFFDFFLEIDNFVDILSKKYSFPLMYIKKLFTWGTYSVLQFEHNDINVLQRLQTMLEDKTNNVTYNPNIKMVSLTDSLNCAGDCSSHGECYFGRCFCDQNYSGANCYRSDGDHPPGPDDHPPKPLSPHAVKLGSAIGIFFGGFLIGFGLLFFLMACRKDFNLPNMSP